MTNTNHTKAMTELRVTRLVKSVLGLGDEQSVDAKLSLKQQGVDSFLVVELTESIAREFGVELGDALHTLVLEGEDVFSRRYVLEPDEEDGKWIRTPQDAKRVLQDKGVDTAGVYGPDLERLARRPCCWTWPGWRAPA